MAQSYHGGRPCDFKTVFFIACRGGIRPRSLVVTFLERTGLSESLSAIGSPGSTISDAITYKQERYMWQAVVDKSDSRLQQTGAVNTAIKTNKVNWHVVKVKIQDLIKIFWVLGKRCHLELVPSVHIVAPRTDTACPARTLVVTRMLSCLVSVFTNSPMPILTL